MYFDIENDFLKMCWHYCNRFLYLLRTYRFREFRFSRSVLRKLTVKLISLLNPLKHDDNCVPPSFTLLSYR